MIWLDLKAAPAYQAYGFEDAGWNSDQSTHGLTLNEYTF